MYFTCDDINTKYIDHLYKLDKLKEKYPDFKVTCFVIAENFSDELKKWLNQDWIEAAVHGYSHDGIPECERDDREKTIKKSYKILKPCLPEKYGYRAPGFQMTASTYPILNKYGFWYLACQYKVQPLKREAWFSRDILINSHIYDDLKYEFKRGEKFKFISEGFH